MRTIRIASQDLAMLFCVDAAEVYSTMPPPYLDLHTGQIVHRQHVAASEAGQGRGAVAEGKRYIRVPFLNELAMSMPAPPAADLAAAFPNDPERQELVREGHKVEMAAKAWLASLQPPVTIEWFDGISTDAAGRWQGPTLEVYDPALGEWKVTQ